MKLIPVLLAVAISGIGVPSEAETRIGIISAAAEPCAGHLTEPSTLNASEIYDAAGELAADALLAAKVGGGADDVFHVTPQGVVLPKGTKHQIPSHYIENAKRPGSYGEMVDGKFKERLRIDPPTPPGPEGPEHEPLPSRWQGQALQPGAGRQGSGIPAMTEKIEQVFEAFDWHDAVLLSLNIDRRTPGERDEVLLLIEWPDGRKQKMQFTDCYALDVQMNFGVIAEESILSARCIPRSEKLDEVRRDWTRMGVDLHDLFCFEIKTNSTASEIRIYAKRFDVADS